MMSENTEKTLDIKYKTVTFAKDNPEVAQLKFILDDPECIDAQMLNGDGMVNYLWRVQSRDKEHSVVIKYGEEQMKSFPGEKVSLERQELEYNCLKLMQSIRPGSAPVPYCFDKKHHIIAMEDMSDCATLSDQLEKHQIDLNGATLLGEILGELHHDTSKQNISQDYWQHLKEDLHHDDLKDYIRAAVLERPYDENDPINKIPEDILADYRMSVQRMDELGLKKKLADVYDVQTCFIHGDCHTKSIFVREGRIALFDFEFAFLGHPAFDVAFPIAAYTLYHLIEGVHSKSSQGDRQMFMAKCKQAVSNLMEGYLRKHTDVGNNDVSRRTFLSDLALLLGGIKFMISVFVHLDVFHDIQKGDRGRMLKSAFHLMENHQSVSNLDGFIDTIFDHE